MTTTGHPHVIVDLRAVESADEAALPEFRRLREHSPDEEPPGA